MDDHICLDCNTLCLQCLSGPDSSPGAHCFCKELQTAHVKAFHDVSGGQPPASLSSLELLDDFIANDALDSLHDDALGESYSPRPHTQIPPSAGPANCIPLPTMTFISEASTAAPLNQSPSDTLRNNLESTKDYGASPYQVFEGGQNTTQLHKGQRRDYMKEKKEFEKWITSNPKPKKSEKDEYARTHNLTENQVQNLINHRKRKVRTRTTEPPMERGERIQTSLGKQQAQAQVVSLFSVADSKGDLSDEMIHSHDLDVECLGDGPATSTLSVPVSDKNLAESLNETSCYSSIEEYLRSPEETVPLETIHRASEESCRPIAKDLRFSMLEARAFLSPTPPKSIASRSSLDSRPTSPVRAPPNPGFMSESGSRSREDLRDSYFGDQSWSGTASIHSTISDASIARSYGSSASQSEVEKRRHESYTQTESNKFPCSFCNQISTTRQAMVDHETKAHCLPQSFPCTFCSERFDSEATWEGHETTYHCEPQLTWFCMLDGHWNVEKCVFCGALLPSHNHYKNTHNLRACDLPLELRTFTTRRQTLQHLEEIHEMTEVELALIKEEIDLWSMKVNASGNRGLWGCGYCNVIGADWDHRLQHIKEHWHNGGPRFTKLHPWSMEKACLGEVDAEEYFKDLDCGKPPHRTRPWNLYFHGYQAYEAAMRHRAGIRDEDLPLRFRKHVLLPRNFRRKTPCTGTHIIDDCEMETIPPGRSDPSTPPPPSRLTSLANRTKTFLNFARVRRKRGEG